ncbi:Cys-Gln thioester bond-forming surface protein [Enterococcus faecalis]|nr:Cys-Gln thioester bond-forming surface protein [Enterococcus faecalis]
MKSLKRYIALFTLLITLGQTVLTPVSIIAEEVRVQENQYIQESKEEISESTDTIGTEPIIEYPLESSEKRVEKNAENARANDSPDESELPKVETIGGSLFILPSKVPLTELTEEEASELVDGEFDPRYTFEYIREHARSTSEQEAMLAQSEEYARMGRNFTRATGYTLEKVKTINEVVVRYLPNSGIHFTHDKFYLFRIRETGDIAFCIEEGIPAVLGSATSTNLDQIISNSKLRNRLSLIAYFGWYSHANQTDQQYVATQHMIWEAFGGQNVYTSISDYASRKQNIESVITKYNTRPSFHNQKLTLKAGESVTLTDTNDVFTNYAMDNMVNTANVTLKKNRNQLTITANNDSNESGNITIARTVKDFSGTALTYQVGQGQRVGVLHVEAPVSVNLSVEVLKHGHAQIKKVDERTGKVLTGAVFRLTTSDGQTKELTTDAKGLIKWENLQADTKLTVQEIKAPSGYVISKESKEIVIKSNKTVELVFNNQEQLGTISLDKKALIGDKEMLNGNYTLEGNEFAVYSGTSTTGKPIETITTDVNGKAKTKNLPLGKYTVKEIKASNGFILNPKTFTIELIYEGQNVAVTNENLSVVNEEQLGSVTLTKVDAETGNLPQGDTSFIGAEFQLIRLSDNKILGTYKTDRNGSFTVDELWIDNYHFIETKAPEGYNLNKTPVKFSIQYAGQTASVAAKATVEKENKVIKGGFDLIKTGNYDWLQSAWNWLTGKDNTDQKIVLEGVEFTVYQEFGEKKEIARKQTDKQGWVGFTDLPYGKYRVSETKTPTGYSRVKDFYVTIDKEGQHFHYVIENKVKEARVKFVKVDSKTGKQIVRSKAGFEIYSESTGEQLVMQDHNGKELSVFFTDENGELQLPTQFAFGKYKAIEVQAPIGYVLASKPTYFTVSGEEKDGLVVVKISNENQKGSLELMKMVEKPIGFVEKESEYGNYFSYEFTQQVGEGFEFIIKATKDIVTGDNTIRLKAGDIVQENGSDLILRTNQEGKFVTQPTLYIGSYQIEEIHAPAGVVMLKEPIPFEIKYEGQLVELTSTSVTIENNLQTIDIIGHKQQETIIDWENGQAVIEIEKAMNDQIFGLFTVDGVTLGFSKVNDGKIAFKELKLPNKEAEYYLQEVDAGNDYVLDETKYAFTYQPQTNEEKHIIHVWSDSFATNEEALLKIARNPIVNRLARATVELIKVDGLDKQPLENVAFNLIRLDERINEEEEITLEETVIGTYVTDSNGRILVEDLPSGQYIFVEKQPLDWYHENNEEYPFEISVENQDETIVIEVENKRLDLEVETVFAETETGAKVVDPTVDNKLTDYVWVRGGKEGHEYFVVTEYINISTQEVVDIESSSFVSKGEEQELLFDLLLLANIMQDGDELVATHRVYSDEDLTDLVSDHFDLANKEQTVGFAVNKTPEIPQAGSYSIWDNWKFKVISFFASLFE